MHGEGKKNAFTRLPVNVTHTHGARDGGLGPFGKRGVSVFVSEDLPQFSFSDEYPYRKHTQTQKFQVEKFLVFTLEQDLRDSKCTSIL